LRGVGNRPWPGRACEVTEVFRAESIEWRRFKPQLQHAPHTVCERTRLTDLFPLARFDSSPKVRPLAPDLDRTLRQHKKADPAIAARRFRFFRTSPPKNRASSTTRPIASSNPTARKRLALLPSPCVAIDAPGTGNNSFHRLSPIAIALFRLLPL
jgi:hypothetical protein